MTICGDSECTISAVDASSSVLASYFANRISEVTSILEKAHTYQGPPISVYEEMPDNQEGCLVDKLQHIAGVANIADLLSRANAKYEDISEGSEWRTGPSFITGHRSKWPVSRDFVRSVPEKEQRAKV